MIGALVESPTGALAEGGSLCSQRPHLALPEGGEGASGVYHPPPLPRRMAPPPVWPPEKIEFLSPSFDPPSQESGSNTKCLSLLLLCEAAKPWLSRGPFGKLFLFLMGLKELAFILSDCSVSCWNMHRAKSLARWKL